LLNYIIVRRNIYVRQKISKPPNQTPWQEIYRNLTGQLSEGACLNLEDKYFQISKTKGIPRDSH